MKKYLVLAAMLVAMAVGCPAQTSGPLVLVKGGVVRGATSNYDGRHVTLSDFLIAKYLVTQRDWIDVMGSNPSRFSGANLPVEMVSWYDAVEYCNRRSLKEGLEPFYRLDKSAKDRNNLLNPKFGDLDTIKWTVTPRPAANGYRLPTEAEWEYAAAGGQLSRSYVYSGSDRIEDVAWYWRNSGDKYMDGYWRWPALEANHDGTKPVGLKKPNELGLYDMSGNVREWCWDWYGDLAHDATDPTGSDSGYSRVWRGGGWMGEAFTDTTAFRGSLAANGRGPDQGFRVARNAPAQK